MSKSRGRIYFTDGIFREFRDLNDWVTKTPPKEPIDLFAKQSEYHQVQEFVGWKHYCKYQDNPNPWWTKQERIELYYYFDPILHSRVYVTSDYRLISAIYDRNWEIQKRIKLIKYPYQPDQLMWKIFDNLKIVNAQLAQALIEHCYYGKRFNINDFGSDLQLNWQSVYQNIVWKYELMVCEYIKKYVIKRYGASEWYKNVSSTDADSVFHKKLTNLKANMYKKPQWLRKIHNSYFYDFQEDAADLNDDVIKDYFTYWWNPYQLFLEREKLLPEVIKNGYKLVLKNNEFYLKINDNRSLEWWWELFDEMSNPDDFHDMLFALNSRVLEDKYKNTKRSKSYE